jgi:cytoskeletal protein CcmA (bactofilin family)
MLKNSFLGRREEPAPKSFDNRPSPDSPRYPPQADATPLSAVAVSTSHTGGAITKPASTELGAQPGGKVAMGNEVVASGPRLTVGPNIKLKGAEINDCDTLVVEGHVEASMDSKTLEIMKSGSYEGTVTIDVAEIHGKFSGNLTARKKLIVHGTGYVTGTVRYGSLLVSEGGMVNGDVASLDNKGADGQSALFAGYPSARAATAAGVAAVPAGTKANGVLEQARA